MEEERVDVRRSAIGSPSAGGAASAARDKKGPDVRSPGFGSRGCGARALYDLVVVGIPEERSETT